MKPRKVTLKQIGYTIRGASLINLWGSGQGEMSMDSSFISLDIFSKTALLKCINDGQFGCESLESAEVDIYDTFDNGYKEFNRTIQVSGSLRYRQDLFCRGV